MKDYHLAGQAITFSCQIPNLETLKQTGAESKPAPVILSLLNYKISQSTGWVAGAERSVELWAADQGYCLRVAGFRDFQISLDGNAIFPVTGESELTDLEEEVVLGPGVVMALALGGKWCLHASGASFQKHGMVFLGESGFGKSTLAAYLHDSADPVWSRIADDILPVTMNSNGLTGWPHFPQLKLPAEQQPALAQPETVLVDKLIQLMPDFSADKPIITRQTTNEVALMLLRNTAGTRMFTPDLLANHMAFCAEAAKHVAGYRLSYVHNRELLPTVKKLLENAL